MTIEQHHNMPALDDDLDAEFEAELAAKGPNWPARILIGLTVLTLTFAGGVWAQQELFTDEPAATGIPDFAALAGGGGLPAGIPEGLAGALGGGGLPGGLGGGTGGGAAADLPAVVGTVVKVSGSTVTVEDLGGNRRTVTVDDATEITQTNDINANQLKAGTSVTVRGDADTDGTVQATEIAAN